jgi:hypothetical protein
MENRENTVSDNIYQCLAAAQAEMNNAVKDSKNPHFKSTYADLASVRDACMPALTRHGIAVIQPLEISETGEYAVKTIFLHASGERLECAIPLILGKRDMQGLGSAMTYARRYGLMALAGIAPEDDDGNAAAESVERNPMGAALGDAWKDGILDALPSNATPRDKAEAFASAICEGFDSKKGIKGLENEWSRRERIIREFQNRHSDLYEKIVEAYTRKESDLRDDDDPDKMVAVE